MSWNGEQNWITDWNWKWNDTWLQISGQRLGLKMKICISLELQNSTQNENIQEYHCSYCKYPKIAFL